MGSFVCVSLCVGSLVSMINPVPNLICFSPGFELHSQLLIFNDRLNPMSMLLSLFYIFVYREKKIVYAIGLHFEKRASYFESKIPPEGYSRYQREGEKHQCVAAFCSPPTGELAHYPGMCPDKESFGWQASTQSTEPLQPGLSFS